MFDRVLLYIRRQLAERVAILFELTIWAGLAGLHLTGVGHGNAVFGLPWLSAILVSGRLGLRIRPLAAAIGAGALAAAAAYIASLQFLLSPSNFDRLMANEGGGAEAFGFLFMLVPFAAVVGLVLGAMGYGIGQAIRSEMQMSRKSEQHEFERR